MYTKTITFTLLLTIAMGLRISKIDIPTAPTLTDLSGKKVKLLGQKGLKGSVFLFVTHDCPVSNQYAPEFNRICKAYQDKGVKFSLIYVEADLKPTDAQKHYNDHLYRCSAFRDPDHKMVKFSGATVTPEAVLFDAAGKKVYLGRIDNLYVALGQRRYEATKHDLRLAIDLLLAGKPIQVAKTMAVGCFIVQN